MTVSEVLRDARNHVVGGWHEPFSLDAAGVLCAHDDEGITRFCVDDALRVAARGDVSLMVAAERELELQHTVAHGTLRPLSAWLTAPTTTRDDVVVLMARAQAHAAAVEAR